MIAVRMNSKSCEPGTVLTEVVDDLDAREAYVGKHFPARKRDRAATPDRRALERAQFTADSLPACRDRRAHRVQA